MSDLIIADHESPITDYLDDVEPTAVRMFAQYARDGIFRLLNGYRSGQFFTGNEQLTLTNAFATSLAVSDLIGRARIQLQADRDREWGLHEEFAEHGIFPWTAKDLAELFTPRAALAFFRKIANIVVEGGAELFSAVMEGRAFSLAVTADKVILDKVSKVIEGRIETGKDMRGAQRVVEEILGETGIAHKNGYGEMVVRTNVMESYRTGSWSRYKDPDLDDLMPAWKYVGIKDGRQRQGPEPERPDHRVHCGKYWPRSISFFDVRGRTARDVINCRCDALAITKRQWNKLASQGHVLQLVPTPDWGME